MEEVQHPDSVYPDDDDQNNDTNRINQNQTDEVQRTKHPFEDATGIRTRLFPFTKGLLGIKDVWPLGEEADFLYYFEQFLDNDIMAELVKQSNN